MPRHRKPPYRRPVNLAWRPAFERLSAALDEFLAGYYDEERRLRHYEMFGVWPPPRVERPRPRNP